MDAQPVIVGIDGSPDSARALQWAAEYGRRYEVPVQVLITWEIPPVYGYPEVLGEKEYAGLEGRARDLLTTTVREALGEDAKVGERVERGHPSEALVAASKDAGLLVVGSRGRGAFAGMLMGSVSQHCVVHAQCPVVVIPHEDVKKR